MSRSPIKVACIVGTRPEAIKMAPLIAALGRDSRIKPILVSTGQHQSILTNTLASLGIEVDFDLQLMRSGESLCSFAAKVLAKLDDMFASIAPDAVLVQGDTTSAFAGGMAAFYRGIPVGHVEAGLRTGNLNSPFPEEAHRKLLSSISTWHFCPTTHAAQNLRDEGVDEKLISVTGNTVIDALDLVSSGTFALNNLRKDLKIIVLTAHRRENFGPPLEAIFQAANEICNKYSDIQIIFPAHPNPKVKLAFEKICDRNARFLVIESLPYGNFVALLKQAWVVMSDSGGIQEEVTFLGIPTLVLRDTTERSEGIASGSLILTGTDRNQIHAVIDRLYSDEKYYKARSTSSPVFGDGRASLRILETLTQHFLELNQNEKMQPLRPNLEYSISR